jgi:hypothetical protein
MWHGYQVRSHKLPETLQEEPQGSAYAMQVEVTITLDRHVRLKSVIRSRDGLWVIIDK